MCVNLQNNQCNCLLAIFFPHLSLALVTAGITLLFKGFNKRSRFYVGRGAPTSLAANNARGESHTVENDVFYNSNEIEQMLVGRKNPTFHEPVTLFDRMTYSFNPKFIFLPYAMRNYLHILMRNTGYSLIGLIVFFIALLSGSVGLTLLTESSFSQWLGIALCLFLIIVWFREPLSLKRVTIKNLHLGKKSNIAWVIALAVLVPSVAELLLRQGVTIPKAPFNPTMALIVFYVLICLVALVGIALAVFRAKLANPTTEISEYRDHWEENVHPKDFFRALDMEMANLRHREIPNRVYRALNPNLQMEGSMDKGSFTGDTIQETQPIFKEIPYPAILKNVRLYTAIAGHVFLVVAALLLYFNQMPSKLSVATLFPVLFYPILLAFFGSMLLTITHLYWGEMQFESYLIQFHGEGTYTESKFTTGKSILDSTESENILVRTSFSPWVLMTRIVSSTQAKPGANAFGYARYVMSMDKADKVMAELINSVTMYLDEKEVIAVATSEKDMKNIEALHALNESKGDVEKLIGEKVEQIPEPK